MFVALLGQYIAGVPAYSRHVAVSGPICSSPIDVAAFERFRQVRCCNAIQASVVPATIGPSAASALIIARGPTTAGRVSPRRR